MISVTEAQEKILSFARSYGSEEVFIQNSYGRITSENIHSDRNYPPFNRSAMDGFAIRSEDLRSYKEFKLTGEVFAGTVSEKEVEAGCCMRIMTGAPVPVGADAVIRVEDSTEENGKIRFAVAEIKSWTNIAKEGEDSLEGSLLIAKNSLITANVSTVLASLGKSVIKVHKLPSVSIISTGDEIKSVDALVLPHQIRDSNSYGLTGFLNHYGIQIISKELVPDKKELIQQAITKGLKSDILILSGGVSMGDADFVPEVLINSGVQKVFHKVSMKPGKPIWFGVSKTGGVVFALPGNPMSAQVAFKVFIEPYLRACFGLDKHIEFLLPINAHRKKRTKFDEYFPCRIANKERAVLEEVKFNGSGDITSTILSDGLAIHEAGVSDLNPDSVIKFIPWRMGI